MFEFTTHKNIDSNVFMYSSERKNMNSVYVYDSFRRERAYNDRHLLQVVRAVLLSRRENVYVLRFPAFTPLGVVDDDNTTRSRIPINHATVLMRDRTIAPDDTVANAVRPFVRPACIG